MVRLNPSQQRPTAAKSYFDFSKGFITEANPLNFPENSSVDEDNFDILRNGSRRRRLGIDYEQGHTFPVSFDISQVRDKTTSVHRWDTVANNGERVFLVIQIGEKLYVHDAATAGALSDNYLGVSIDLNDYKQPNSTSVGTIPLDGIAGKGRLFLVSPEINPIYLSYDPDTDNLIVTEYNLFIRDFAGLIDNLDVDERPSDLSAEHHYNLLNQGWDDSKINHTKSTQSVYPSNADIWYIAKDVDDDYDSEILIKQDFGTSQALKGRFILNAFLDNKSEASGIGDLLEKPIKKRPASCTFFAGRVFYVLEEKVYYTQILESDEQIGFCYQSADPTSEHQSDLVDSDGGVIQIPDMGDGTCIKATADYLLVGSNRGIWQIRAPTGEGFTATNFSVSRITNIGIASHRNIIIAEDTPVFLSNGGFYIMDRDQIDADLIPKSLSETTVQSYFLDINPKARQFSNLVYDLANKKIFMFYNSDPDFDGVTYKHRYDKVLIFDSLKNAFHKYSISPLENNSPFIYGAFTTPDFITEFTESQVIDGSGNNVVSSLNELVVIDEEVSLGSATSLKMLVVVLDNGSNFNYTIGEFNNIHFRDWETEDGTGVDFSSYLETGYETGNDALRNKQASYINCFFERTEAAFILNENSELDFDRPSGCIMTAKWDFTLSEAPHRWEQQQQVYRFRVPFIPGGPGEAFDYGYSVIETKNKVRGKGKALSIRFESETGKDCRLLGWAVLFTANREP